MHKHRKWNMGLLSGESAALVLLCACFVVGSVSGCAVSVLMDTDCGWDLLELAREYLVCLGQGDVRPDFLPLVWDVIQFPLLAFLLGFTALGVLGFPVLFALRGFLFSFAVSSFVRLFGITGEMLAFFLFGLSAVIWMPVLFHLGVQGMLASYGLLRRTAGEGRYPLRYNCHFLIRSGLCAGALVACIALEYLVVPILVQVIVGVL